MTATPLPIYNVLVAALAHVNRDMQPGGGNTLTQCRWLAKNLRAAKKRYTPLSKMRKVK